VGDLAGGRKYLVLGPGKRRLSPSRQGGGVDGGSPEVGSDQYLCC
jgi:hypothetical protein